MPTLIVSHIQIGQDISNAELVSIFKCGNMGGMRRSHKWTANVMTSVGEQMC